jgi:hypothetical protein
MPINLRTHAHGQGYADLNFLMPETVNALDTRKGPLVRQVARNSNTAVAVEVASRVTAGIRAASPSSRLALMPARA